METYPVRITSIEHVTHDVLRLVTVKPAKYAFNPGQATKIAINKNGWRTEQRPFTFTCLPTESYLEFTIKTYPDHEGVTNQLLSLQRNDELILHEVIGAISYKGEGVFIAGGAGVTPFISIFRDLASKELIGNNMLVFANKTQKDIILEQEFTEMLGDAFINILSDEKTKQYAQGKVSEEFLESTIADFNQQFYLCGPPPMMDSVRTQLSNLGVKKGDITVEKI